jgi:LPXTG-site transpeptidase (sortase) family protein
MDDPVPEEPHADFLRTIRGMVQDERAEQPKTPSRPGARRADKSLRRHEDKLTRAERRNARKHRKRARTPQAAPPREQPAERTHQVQRVPAQATETSAEDLAELDAATAVVQGQASLSGRARRRERRRATALAAAGQTEDEPELVLADGSASTVLGRGRPSRAERRAERRREAARAVAEALPLTEPGGPDSGDERPATPLEPGDSEGGHSGGGPCEPGDSMRPPRGPGTSRMRRAGKVAAVVVVIAAAIAVPWADPSVPAALSGILPGHGGQTVHAKDPAVAPPTAAVVGPVGVDQQGGPYAGVRLEAAGHPREVVVPRLHVDSDVVPISGQSGSLLPPSDPQLLGWWQEGRPVGAQHGTAVITGHTVHTGGGALDHLGELVVGDTLRVRTDAGWIQYAVKQTRIYSTEELAQDAENLFRLGGPGRLVLITCDDWNGQFYESNAVVVATPVLDEPATN